MHSPLLDVQELQVHFPSRAPWPWSPRPAPVRAVDGISFHVRAGETFGLVGESGCGKSTTARAITGLIRPTAGRVVFEGDPIDRLHESAMRSYRRRLQMIFQDPMASLNPRMSVGRIIAEPLHVFRMEERKHWKLEVMRLMDMVGLNPRYLNRYPHEFSGGQRQRVGVARALAVQPKLIFCDEAVSALDVSIQAQVINLLVELKEKLGLAYVFIAHDLSVVRHISDRVGVMYRGRLVETAGAGALYASPRHPYTKCLLAAAPIPDPVRQHARERVALKGEIELRPEAACGCLFADRCPLADDHCREKSPPLEGDGEHQVACWKA